MSGGVAHILQIPTRADDVRIQHDRQVRKEEDLFNLNAQYDGLMGDKVSIPELQHRVHIDTAHIGIVFRMNTYVYVLELSLNDQFTQRSATAEYEYGHELHL